jgi:hypothetical protein
MGTGAEGHFSGRADLTRWAIFTVWESGKDLPHDHPDKFHSLLFGRFINAWWRIAQARPATWILDPYLGHGTWAGVDAREWLSKEKYDIGNIAVLTRATVHWRSMKTFHGTAGSFGKSPLNAPGCQLAIGIGEWPLRLQATFSIWTDEASMKSFAYGDALHQDTIRRTRQEGWYKEELFLRARVVAFVGSDGSWACGPNP